MSRADVFLFRVNTDELANRSISAQKKAVSDFSREFVSFHTSQVTGVSPDKLEYIYGEHGKPYIKGNPLYFNVSHCGNIVLAAFASEEIGADIELVRTFNWAVVKKLFTCEEKNYMELSPNQTEADKRFFEIWTAKEAFLKLLGVGISGGLGFCTADEKGLRTDIFSPKFGSSRIIHKGGKIELCKNDIMLYNMKKYDGFANKYQISVCGREIRGINFQLIKNI